ncbi:MAG: dimethylmenaquinone methyltransferase [Bryobacteraceae bacterium]
MPKHGHTVAFVPAKSQSSRIENKNMRILDGEYLFRRKLRQLVKCPLIDQVYLDTDSDEMAQLAADLPVTRLKRPDSLASNATDGHELFAWECAQVEADTYIQALCTSPFIDENTVARALAELEEASEADSVVAVTAQKQYTWTGGAPAYGWGRIPNSVDLPPVIVEAMGLYVVRAQGTRPTQRFGRKPLLFDLKPQELIDLNWPEDLELAEAICAGHRAAANLALAQRMPYLSSSLLGDVSKELGLKAILPAHIRAQGPHKIFGRAKTLELGPVREGESWRGIYSALDSYDFIRPGDIIVVATAVPEYAYFGELNANLAIRAGAAGAVINGFTRDTDAVNLLRFPVFARGSYCADIRLEGTVRSMNSTVTIGEVTIGNNDFVFADSDGVVVISERNWPEVAAVAWKRIEQEWTIKMRIALGLPPREILKETGPF